MKKVFIKGARKLPASTRPRPHSINTKKLARYVSELKRKVPVKLIPVPERRSNETWRNWQIKNGKALKQNWETQRTTMFAERQNTAKAIVIEEIQRVIIENPFIAQEDLKLQVFKRLQANSLVGTSLTQQLLSPTAIQNLYRELAKMGLIKQRA